MSFVIRDPAERARFDRAIVQSALDGRHLPAYLPLEPPAWGAGHGAARVVPIVLDALRDAHGVDAWTPESFERVFLGEAMRAWHGELDVAHPEPAKLVARTATCPVLAQASRDARVCQMCRAMQTMAAQEAFGFRLRGVTFPKLVTRGDEACEMRLATAP